MPQAQLCVDGQAHTFQATCARNEATDRGTNFTQPFHTNFTQPKPHVRGTRLLIVA